MSENSDIKDQRPGADASEGIKESEQSGDKKSEDKGGVVIGIQKNDDSEDDRFHFRTIDSLDYPVTPIRNQEFHRFIKILQAPIMKIPLLVVERQEDALPLLSLVTREVQEENKPVSFFSVTPSDFDMDYDDNTISFDAEKNMDLAGTILEYGDKTGSIPVYCDLSKYINSSSVGEFIRNFLDIERTSVILCRQKELDDVHKVINKDRELSGGLENPESPYLQKGFAQTCELKVSPMTDDEKKVYFSYHLDKMLYENGLICPRIISDYLIQEALRRCPHETVFFKTFEVMDRAMALAQLVDEEVITRRMVKQALEEKMPLHNRTKALVDMDKRLRKKIFGQDQAIDKCYEAILSRLDDEHREKPTVLAFFGPSGVGKTALAEEISLAMTGKKINTINMAEYSDSFKVSILTGSSKGYVDSDEDGLLAKIVKENPRAVILLDEFEKADPQVQQMFLGVFDKGSVFDNHAGEIDMSQTTIILTSNAGIRSEKTIGFGGVSSDSRYVADEKMVQDAFPKELLGRIDAKIFFQPLTPKMLDKIIDKFMETLKPRFTQLGVTVGLTKKARQELVEAGKDPAAGARPLLSLIRQKVKTPVEIAVLKRKIKKGSHVIINSVSEKGMKIVPAQKVRRSSKSELTRV